MRLLTSASKKTKIFPVFDKKAPNTRLSKFLKPRSLLFVNDCFKNENNEVVGVFLQRLTKILLFSAVFILQAGGLTAQRNLNEGNKYFDRNMFEEAIPHYLKEIDRGKNYRAKNEAREKLASCYRLTGRFLEANEMYKKILDRSGRYNKTEHVLNYANSLKSSALYEEAAEQFKKYMKLEPDDPMGEIYLQSCYMAQDWLLEEKEYFVMNFERINTAESEFGPSYLGDGIVFTSERKDSKKKFINFSTLGNELRTDLYYFNLNQLNNEEYSTENFDEVNSFLHDGAAAFSKDGNTVYFTRTIMGEKNRKTNVVLNSLQIYVSHKQSDGTWSEPRSAFSFNSENYSVGQPSVSPDGKRIYFISDMPGGYGKTDIYYTELSDNGEWGPPINLGEPVNTFGHELFPCIHSEDTLFFSSDTHPGMGKLDIFRATQSDRGWDKVENMKTPVNSIGDDFGIVMNERQTRGFFSSDRFNGKGKEDIFTLYREEPLHLSFNGNELKIPDNTLYSGITFKISKENDDKSEALVSEDGFYSCTLHEDTVYNLTLRKNRFFYDVVKLKLNNLTEEENFSIDVIPRKASVVLSGMVAEKNVEIKKIEPEKSKKTKKEEELAVLYDTIVEYKAVPFADLVLTTENMEIKKTTAGKDGDFNFEGSLPGGSSYRVMASRNEEKLEEFEEFTEEQIEPDDQPNDDKEELLTEESEPDDQPDEANEEVLAEDNDPVEEEEEVSPESLEDEIMKEFMQSGKLEEAEEPEEPVAAVEETGIEEKAVETDPTLELKGTLVDEKKIAIEGGNVKVFDGDDLLGDTESDRRGEFEVEVPEKEKYLVSVTKEGFFQEQLEVSKGESLSGIPVKVDLKPIEVNKTVRVNNIFFDYNKYDLRPESLVELDRLADFLSVNSDVKIELNAHTDSRGGYYFNLQLSHNRAEAVKSYLSLNGIDPSRIIVRGYGESFPDIPNPTNEAEHARNRRVEFRVIEYGKPENPVANAMINSKGYMILDECPYSSANPFPLTGDVPRGVVYRVKIGEYRNALPNNAFRGLFPVVRSRDERNNTWEYYAGLFNTLEDAEIAVEMIRRSICKDAYVTASYKREQVSIEEALKITERLKENQGEGGHSPEKVLAARHPEACFSIQIGAFKRKVRNSIMKEFREIAGDHELIRIKSRGVTIYSVGRFYSYEEAFGALKSITNDKITKDAFIIGLQDGRKISIGEARNYLRRHKSAMR